MFNFGDPNIMRVDGEEQPTPIGRTSDPNLNISKTTQAEIDAASIAAARSLAMTPYSELDAEERAAMSAKERADYIKAAREEQASIDAEERAASDPMFNFTVRPAPPAPDENYLYYYTWIGGANSGSWELYRAPNDAENMSKYGSRTVAGETQATPDDIQGANALIKQPKPIKDKDGNITGWETPDGIDGDNQSSTATFKSVSQRNTEAADKIRAEETAKLLARYKKMGMNDADAQKAVDDFWKEASASYARGYEIDENGNKIPLYGSPASGFFGTASTAKTVVSSNIPTGADATTKALIQSLQKQISDLTKQVTTTANTTSAATTSTQYNERMGVYSAMAERFNKYGLTSLANKIKELAVAGATESTITLQLMETPEYQQRFAANADRLKKGLSVLTPAEYVNVEDSYRQVLRAYGLKQFDNDAYVRQFIANDMSPTELSNRVVTAVQRVQNADPALVNQLKQYYGIGAQDMVAYVLDPEQQFQKIERQIAASEIGVAAGRQGLQAGVSVAEQLAAQGVSEAEARKGYATIADILPTAEKLSDIYGTTMEEYRQAEGEQEVFNSLASAQRKRQKLTAREVAAFSGASGTNKTSLTTSAVGQF